MSDSTGCVSCVSCKYWDPANLPMIGATPTPQGLCRINPPSSIQMRGPMRNISWPITAANDWCGRGEE